MVKIKRIKTPGDIPLELLTDIRSLDFRELLMGPEKPEQAIRSSIENSRYCYAVRDKEDHLLAVFGIAAGTIDVCGTQATPIWFLGTILAYKHNKALVYYGQEFSERFIKKVGPLCNFIWQGNEPSIRYIQHLGAEFLDPQPMGKKGEIFYPFLLKEVKRYV